MGVIFAAMRYEIFPDKNQHRGKQRRESETVKERKRKRQSGS